MTNDEVFTEFSDKLMRTSRLFLDDEGSGLLLADRRMFLLAMGKATIIHGMSMLGNSVDLKADESIELAKKMLVMFQEYLKEHKAEMLEGIMDAETDQ